MAHVYVRSGAGGAATGADWANAYLTLGAAHAAKAAGDQFWLAVDHAESTAGAVTLTSPGTAANPCTIACVNHAGSVPPVSADLTTGATIATTGANSITIGGHAFCQGIEFKIASSTSAGNMNICTVTTGWWSFGTAALPCKITFVGTGASKVIIGVAGAANACDWRGVIVKFSAVNQFISIVQSRFDWRGGSVDAAGTAPTVLFAVTQGGAGFVEYVDFSALGSGKTLIGAASAAYDYHFKDCKLGTSVTRTSAPTGPGSQRARFSRTSSSGIVYEDSQHLYTGTELAVVNVIRAGGSLSSHKIDSTANAKFILPYQGLPLAIYNSVTGSNRTVTLYGIANMAAMPKNDELWLNIVYLGDAASPLGSIKTSSKADILATGSSLTADTSAWDGSTTARANTTAYVVGDVIKVASNAGRVFFCTTSGTSAGSEPVGFSTAIDGGSVTDNTAVFRAGWRFSIAIILTSPQPALVGPIYVYPRVGAASAQIYLGRKLGLS